MAMLQFTKQLPGRFLLIAVVVSLAVITIYGVVHGFATGLTLLAAVVYVIMHAGIFGYLYQRFHHHDEAFKKFKGDAETASLQNKRYRTNVSRAGAAWTRCKREKQKYGLCIGALTALIIAGGIAPLLAFMQVYAKRPSLGVLFLRGPFLFFDEHRKLARIVLSDNPGLTQGVMLGGFFLGLILAAIIWYNASKLKPTPVPKRD